MRNKIIYNLMAIVFIVGLAVPTFASMGSENYGITESVFSNGGGLMGSDNYAADSTLGQPSPLMEDVQPVSTNYALYPGFWYSMSAIQIDISANEICEYQNYFNGGDTVYGKANLGLAANTSYPLYVVDDRSDWLDGMEIPASCSKCGTPPESSFTTDTSGNMPCGTIVWQNTRVTVSPAAFDIIIDANGNGNFDFGVDFIDSVSVEGFITLVKLASFKATASSNRIILSWQTESEIDNAGFNLYRSDSEGGEYAKINGSLISAKGSPTQGVSYEFVDSDVKNRKTYYYKLEDIDLNGTSTMHGPVSAMPRWIYGQK